MSLIRILASFGVLALSVSSSVAQVSPIVTDRPSEATGTVIVPQGSAQFELGYKYEEDRDAMETSIDTQTLPDLLLRAGLHSQLEARLVASGWSFIDSALGGENGFNDIGLGLKWRMLDPDGTGPAVSMLFELTAPVGSDGFSGDFVNPKALLLLDQSLSETVGLTANVGAQVLRTGDSATDERTVTDLPYAALLSRSLSDRVGLFAELHGTFAMNERPDRHSLQAGLTVAVASRLQLDVRGAAGLVDDAATWLIGAGVSFRLLR